jgi:penicillin-binding protein 1C
LKSERYYGLALALGGAEISMQELTSLYALLANEGKWFPLKMVAAHSTEKGRPLLSKEASYLVAEMLKETDKPQSGWNNNQLSQHISWKTGTSSGYRDAWTVGIVGPYVLSVWIGNFNNQSNPAFIGKEIAAPLFFEIISGLKQQIDFTPRQVHLQRMHLTEVEVCKVSGMLPNHYCPEKVKTWFIPGKSPIKVDNIHREIAIDQRTGLRACQFDQHTRFEVYEFWPSDLLTIFKRAGLQRKQPPAMDPACVFNSKIGDGFAPQITSPQSEIKYVARLSDHTNSLLPLTAVVDADVKNLYWFVNETFLGKSGRDKPFLWQTASGRFIIRVVDDFGRSDARNVNVVLET